MLESYISPFLLGYVDKYIKNLKPEDLQLSLWGGDLVLNNLELRLDALERDLNLPLSFVNGFLHELRIHVPWTRIGYEPVEISINTIECTLKLRDSGVDDSDSVSSKSSTSTSTNKSKGEPGVKAKPKEAIPDASLSPGYVTSLMNRVLHNVKVSVKNLILKYVEDDIVLSVHVQTFDTFATDNDWREAFVELCLPELVLRRMCSFSDITVCLDKRNASGKIEVYQEPVVFRCAVNTRLHLTYNSLNAKRVSAVKVSTYCEELKMALSDTQLPMFLRVLQLVAALYYGSIDLPGAELKKDEDSKEQEVSTTANPGPGTKPEDTPVGLDPSSGWMNWAWSLVPDLLTYEEEGDGREEGGGVSPYGGGRLRKRRDPILSVGFYCNKASLEFKVTDPAEGKGLYAGPKLSFHQSLLFEMGGTAIDILMEGERFFSAQVGVSHVGLFSMGFCPCDVTQPTENRHCFITCGDADYQDKPGNYRSLSLFDQESPENHRQKTIYVLEGEHHQSIYTEAWSSAKFGAFWLDYLFTYEKLKGLDGNDSSSRSSHQSETDPIFTTKETSWKRFVFAPATVTVSSSLVHRLQQLAYFAGNHDYEPYFTPKPEVVDEDRPTPTPDQVAGMEESIPQRHSHFAVLGLEVIVMAAEHGHYDPYSGGEFKSAHTVPPTMIPVVSVRCQRVDYQVTVPMYARKLVRAASKVSHPSSALLHHCYSQNSYKVFGLEVKLTFDASVGDLSPSSITVLQPCSFAGLSKALCLPMYWTDPNIVKSELMLEMPAARLDFTKAQLLLLLHIHQSWAGGDHSNTWIQETSLLEDTFMQTGEVRPSGQAVLVASMASLDVRYVDNASIKALTGSIGQAQIAVLLGGDAAVPTPIFQGPLSTDKVHQIGAFLPPSKATPTPPRTGDFTLLTFTVQLPRSIGQKGSVGAVLVKMDGTSLCLDPALLTWLLYQPRRRPVTTRTHEASDRAGRSPVPENRSPVKRQSSQGSETFKGPKSVARFSKQKSVTATPIMEEESEEETEASGQASWLSNIIKNLKELIIQVDVDPCIIVSPTTPLAFTSHGMTIPQYLRELGRSEGPPTPHPLTSSSAPALLVVCVPALSVHSSGHKAVDPSQDLPLGRMDLPQEPGEKFPWTIRATDFAIFSMHDFQRVYYLLEPMAISSTLALTSNERSPSEAPGKPLFGLGVHTDMPAVTLKISAQQVSLVNALVQSVLKQREDLIRAFDFTMFAPAPSGSKRGATQTPSSPSKSTPHLAPTITTATSSCGSSGQPDEGSADVRSASMPSETPVSASLRGGDGDGVGEGRREDKVTFSLWVQWTLHKLSLVCYGRDKAGPQAEHPVRVCVDMEDVTTSIDLQDVYSKVTWKVGALNVHHFVKNEQGWVPGPFKGVLLSCTDTMTHNVEISPPFKRLRTQPQPANPFSLHAGSKAAEAKQTHAFLSLTWTRALGASVAKKMSGGKSEKLPDARTLGDESAKLKRFVNEVIVSSRAFDVILWCPILAAAVDILLLAQTGEGDRGTGSEHETGAGRFRASVDVDGNAPIRSVASDAMSWQSVSHRSTRSQQPIKSLKSTHQAAGFSDWLTSSQLPLLYLDCKEIRTFVPASVRNVAERDGRTARAIDNEDLFLFQISGISLVPYADNPLQRLVVKQDIFRRATLAGITQQPGSELEDRQYQLDVTGVSLSVASWEQVMRASEQGQMKVGSSGVTRSKTQNPALEWNLSLPKQDTEEVKLTPILQDFDLHLLAAPAIAMERHRAERGKQKVVVCGHSLEFSITTDLVLYLSTEQVHLGYCVLDSNLHHLLPKRGVAAPLPPTSHTQAPPPRATPPSSRLPPSQSLEDSGLGSDCFPHHSSPLAPQRRGMAESPRPTILAPQPQRSGGVQAVAAETGGVTHQPKRRSRAKGVTPFDLLMTGRKVTLFLYSRKGQLKTKIAPTSTEESTYPTSPSTSTSKRRLSTSSSPAMHPFLLLILSQPSLVMSVERPRQKLEVSFYDFRINGAAVNKHVKERSLPQAMDFPVPWFQTCTGVPDPKTGVKPALFTFTVQDFMMRSAAVVKLVIGRPVKVNFSLTKVQQARGYLKQLQPTRRQEVTKVPLKAEEISLMTLAKNGEKSIGISLPGQHASHGDRQKTKSQNSSTGVIESLTMLSHLQTIVVATSQVVVVMATTPDPDFPHVVASVGETVLESFIAVDQNTGELTQADSTLQLYDFLIKTSLQHSTKPLLGPLTFDLALRTNQEPHSASEASPLLPRVFADVSVKSVPISLGQDNLHCLSLVIDRMSEALGGRGVNEERRRTRPKKTSVPVKETTGPSPREGYSRRTDVYGDEESEGEMEDREEEDEDGGNEPPEGVTQVEYKDDLRTGAFEYFTEGHTETDIPLPNQIFFTPASPEGGHWGTMVWTYPEPRINVGLTVTPVPVSCPDTTGSTRTKKIPCLLQSFDEQRQCFVTAMRFFVSETRPFQKRLRILETRDRVEEAEPRRTWRVLLNTTPERQAQGVSLNLPTPDIIVSPMTLAASMRFDTVFAPRFIQFCYLKVSVDLIELKLTNQRSQLGQGQPGYLKPFIPDGTSPRDHEFLVVRIPETKLVLESYGGIHARTRISGIGGLSADVLNYHNLTMSPLLQRNMFEVGCSVRSLSDIEGSLLFNDMTFMVGQGTVHTLSKAAQAWAQSQKPDSERLFYGHYLICNATNQTLRFGQVHTDESVVLETGKLHEYCWRSHKQEKQELHVCVENWRNFRWSEPFSIDGADGAVTVRVLHNKEKTATLFIHIRRITALQRQVTITGPQGFSSQLSLTLDLQVMRSSSSNSPRPSDPRETFTLAPFSTLPALTCPDDDITGVRLRVKQSSAECDWSEQFAVSGQMCRMEMVVKVPCSDGKKFYFWCQVFAKEHEGHVQRQVVFSPVFSIQSHLPHPITLHCQAARGNDLQVTEVRGQGSTHQLHQIPPMAWYNLSLSSSSIAPSAVNSTAICISTEQLESVTKHQDEAVGLRPITEDEENEEDLSQFWPYNHADYTSDKLHAATQQHLTLVPPTDEAGPTHLQIGMVQHRPKTNTIRVEIMPVCLLVNETDMDLTMREKGGDTVIVKRGTTVAPHKLTGTISLTMSHEEVDYLCSKSLQLVTDTDTPPKSNGSLHEVRLQPVDYGTIELHSRGSQPGKRKVVHAVVQSTVRHTIRVVTVRPRFVFRNNSKVDVRIRTQNLQAEEKISFPATNFHSILLPAKSSEYTPQLQWESPPCTQPMGSFHYLSLALIGQEAPEGAWLDEWSCWLKIEGEFPRVPFTVPVTNPSKYFQLTPIVTRPMVAMVIQHEGVTYVTLEDDPSPKALVVNRCPFPIHVGHSKEHAKTEDALEIEEEAGALPKVPTVPPGAVCHYNLPLGSQSQNTSLHKFHFALAPAPGVLSLPSPRRMTLDEQGSKVDGCAWSEAVGILDACGPTRSEIVAMPTGGYLLVVTECVGTLMHIFIESLDAEDGEREVEVGGDPPHISLSLGSGGITVKVMNDLTPRAEVREMLRLTAKNISVAVVAREDLKRTKALRSVHLLQLTVGEMQLDNQIHGAGGFDFPVLFRGHARSEVNYLPEIDPSFQLTPDRWYNLVYADARENRQSSFLSVHVFVEGSEGFGSRLRSAEIALNDMEAFVEDQFVHRVKDVITTYSPVVGIKQQKAACRGTPSIVQLASCALRSPLSVQQLTVQPIALTASVHASLRLFLALDRTKLVFQRYETGPVFATVRQLGQALTLHYTSGALFKAGWAIGSLDLIGNPAGFLRSVRTGLYDTVYLPYEGLTRGPGAFVSGVASGMSSLVRHLSAGTLSSITKFASSMSRNLDRLSLDADHVARREEERRRVPEGMSAGIVQGLSSFGICLLGAIAGIADQPLRSFQDTASDPVTSVTPTQRARGVISGVGKGLVGAVVKPLGGAAEFVAQTGQGILHGTGLAEQLTPQGAPYAESRSSAVNAKLKYEWKMLQTLPISELLYHVEVTSTSVQGLPRGGALLLTPEVLYVVGSSEDTLQLTLPLCDVDCRPARSNPKGLKVVVKKPKSNIDHKRAPTADRVADFVAATSDTSGHEDSPSPGSDSASEASGQRSQEVERLYQYSVAATPLKGDFLTMFAMAKNRLAGIGFCYDEQDDVESRQLQSASDRVTYE